MAERTIDLERAQGDLLHCAALVAESLAGTDAYAEAIGPIAAEFARRGEFDLGVNLADGISDPFARDQVLADIAVVCAGTGDTDYAVELIDSLDEVSFQTLARANLAVAEAERGNAERAIELAQQLEDPSGALAEIAIRLAANGQFAEAIDAAEGAEFQGSRAWAFTEIGAKYLENGNHEEGQANLERALEEADELELPDERISLWLDVAVPLKAAGDDDRIGEIVEEAETEAPDIASEVARDRSLTRIVETNAMVGRFDKADELIETIEDPLQAAAAMISLAPHLRTAGQTEKARTALDEALKLINETDVWEERSLNAKERLQANIAVRYFEAEDPAKAREVAESIHTENLRAQILFTLASRLLDAGEIESAKAMMEPIPGDYTRAIYWTEFGRRLAETNPEAAARALERARKEAPKAANLFQRADAYSRIAAQSGGETARMWYTKALDTAAEIAGSTQRALALLSLAQAYAAAELDLTAAEKETLGEIARYAM